MKKIAVHLILILVPFLIQAQTTPMDALFDKYSGEEGYTSVYISKYMFELFAKIVDEEEDKEFKEVVGGLNSIKILATDEKAGAKQNKEFYKEILNSLSEIDYKELMIVKDGAEEVKFLIHEKDGKISGLVMVVGGEDESVLISMDGNIDLKNISKLSKSMNISGMEHLDKIEKNKKDINKKKQ
ncbi:MAG: DUF4252 domain-containing protein [Bacteroidota bacterium]